MYDDDDEYYDPEFEDEHGVNEPVHSNHDDDDEGPGTEEPHHDAEPHVNYAAFIPNLGRGYECTCSGRCLCRYYSPKGVYDTDCAGCGHAQSDHRPR